MRFFVLLILIFSSTAWALPGQVEIWFLKEPKPGTTFLNPSFLFYKQKFAALSEDNCIPMEGGCFHPQLGLIEKGQGYFDSKEESKDPTENFNNKNQKNFIDSYEQVTQEDVEKEQSKKENSLTSGKMKTFIAPENEKVDCDKAQFFDIYCGKARADKAATPKNGNLEIWIDVSSSFKSIDYSSDGENCFRRQFVTKVGQWCKGKAYFSVYNTSIKEVMTDDSFCNNYGLNDEDRMIDWIKSNNSKHLLVITDVSEMSTKISNFIHAIGAKTKGLDAQDFVAKDMLSTEAHVKSLCK